MLLGADTNIVVRLIVEDDTAQVDRILALLSHHELFVPLTVMLEAEWVLRSRYRLSRMEIATAFAALCRLESIWVEEAGKLTWAIDQYRLSGDFGDFVHILSCDDCEGFATFDAALQRAASTDWPVSVMDVP